LADLGIQFEVSALTTEKFDEVITEYKKDYQDGVARNRYTKIISERLQNFNKAVRTKNLWRLNEILTEIFGENSVSIGDILEEKNVYERKLGRFQPNSKQAKEAQNNIEMLTEALALWETLELPKEDIDNGTPLSSNEEKENVQSESKATAKASPFPPSAPLDENQNIPSSNEGYDLPQPPVNATAVDNGQDDQSMNLKDLVGTYDFVKAPRTAEAIILAMLGNIASLQANEIVRIQIPEAFRCAASSRVSELEKRL
jgi:hypothetical protein